MPTFTALYSQNAFKSMYTAKFITTVSTSYARIKVANIVTYASILEKVDW